MSVKTNPALPTAFSVSSTLTFPPRDTDLLIPGKSLAINAAPELPASLTRSGFFRMPNSGIACSSPSLVAEPVLHSETRPSILVVDDEPLYLELLADILGDDYEVLVAAQGMTGLEIAAEKVPHLILLDVMMPEIDGFEFFSFLKSDPRTCEIPIIFITGRGDSEAETWGLKMGAVDYITKPLNAELVKARVNIQIRFKLMQDKLAKLTAPSGFGDFDRDHLSNN